MLRDITIRKYYPSGSVLHRLDPRTKLGGTLLFIVSLFLANKWSGYLVAAIFLFTCIKLSKVPLGYIVRGLKPVIFLLMFSVIFNLFLTDGQELIHIWIFRITVEGLVQALLMAMRLIFLIMGSSLMTFCTTPNALTDGMESALSFLKVFHVPVHEIAMMMNIALRFIPILTDETDKIMKAQMARGADFETGGLLKRAKALIPLLVPLFISAFRRASDLAMAMEARCYHGGDGRTKMRPLRWSRADGIAWLVLAAYLGLVILTRVL